MPRLAFIMTIELKLRDEDLLQSRDMGTVRRSCGGSSVRRGADWLRTWST
jgi:hypothetical protein